MPSYNSDSDKRHRRDEHRGTRPRDHRDRDTRPDDGRPGGHLDKASRHKDERGDRGSHRRPHEDHHRGAGLTDDSRRRSSRKQRSHSRSRSRDGRKAPGSRHPDRSKSPRPSGVLKHTGRESARSRSRSPPPKRRRRSPARSESPPRHRRRHSPEKPKASSPYRRSKQPLPSQEASFQGKDNAAGPDGEVIEKQKPNFGNSGLLARETNTIAGTGIVLKYNEPAEARKPPPSQAWRLYIFKGEEVLETVPLHVQSCWLLGRETTVVDLPVEHPSTSKQHTVIQFRHTTKVNEFGDKTGTVKPYIIDLESSNGTILNGDKIEASRFVEIKSGDVMKIGLSQREYVFILPPPE